MFNVGACLLSSPLTIHEGPTGQQRGSNALQQPVTTSIRFMSRYGERKPLIPDRVEGGAAGPAPPRIIRERLVAGIRITQICRVRGFVPMGMAMQYA
jgi:hypothetical protein